MATNGQPVLATDLADASLEDPAATSIAADSLANDADADIGESGEEDEEGEQETGTTTAAKKKRKPRKKKKNKSAIDESIPSTTSISAQPPAQPQKDLAAKKVPPVHDIQSLLNQLAMSSQQQQPKPEAKAPQDYKFWNTQPVPKFQEPNLLQLTTPNSSSETSAPLPEGPILPHKICRASAKSEPGALRDGFEWCLVDLEAEDEVKELYDLLDNHYVEDAEASFRFKYSVAFLSWALKPPGWKREWHIGVRTATSPEGKKAKLVAFIAGIPVRLKVGEASMNGVEINFLAIHRKLRGKRLAPELIKEVTRRCYRNEIFQALYTAGTLLPTPVSTCRYFHRSLDWEHLYKTGFSHLPPGSSELKQRVKYRLESQPTLKGLRPMRKGDVSAVKALLERYLDRFHLRQAWTEEEVEHWFCSEASQGVVWAYVVESEDGSGVEDFVSYYLLEVSSHRLDIADERNVLRNTVCPSLLLMLT